MSEHTVTDVVDVNLVACLGLFLLGILASTLWIASFDGGRQLVGLVFIFAGLVACALGMERQESAEISEIE